MLKWAWNVGIKTDLMLLKAEKPVKKTTKKATKAKAEEVPVETEKDVEETPVEEAPKKKRGRKPKVVEDTPTEE